MFLRAIFASSAICFTCLTNSRLLSSVRAGMTRKMTSPLLFGVRPILASKMAFSISPNILLSNGFIDYCLASGIEILASCFNGVGAP